jgi:NADP-dependent 3-hydroxy acid dehydrogenase YdfG
MKNKTVLITGASSGIGYACAKAFANLGAHLILVARREERLLELKNSLPNVEAKIEVLDVRDQKAVFEFAKNNQENIDVLINNAGCALGQEPLYEADLNDLNAMIDINIKGLLYFTQAFLPRMIALKSGHVINIGSTAAYNVYAGGAIYCATKHAVHALTKGLKLDTVNTGVRVTEIDPGMVETEFSLVRYKGDQDRAHKIYNNIERPITADDIADTIVFACTRPAHVNIAQIMLYSVDQPDRLPM